MPESEEITGVNIIPLVSVALVLVIIIMVTAPILLQPTLDIDLPKAHTVEGEEGEKVMITITMDGQWAVDEKRLPKEKVLEELKIRIAKCRKKFVVIRADRNASFGELLEAMRLSKLAGAKKLTIATKQK
jgi:biopolymer transport protein ExbD